MDEGRGNPLKYPQREKKCPKTPCKYQSKRRDISEKVDSRLKAGKMTGEKIRQEGRGRGIAQKREAEEKYGEERPGQGIAPSRNARGKERPDADSRRYEMRGKSMESRWQGKEHCIEQPGNRKGRKSDGR